MKKPRLRLITSLFLLSLLSRVPAEVITDGTVGPPSTLSGPNYMIGHDLGSQSGTNLYHSFDKFNVNTGESATFTGPLDINNVFGRVTGSESFIDGQISSDMPNADIYLINPRGIMFGQNATLNVPGSFYASTADQIILKDGTTFSATNPQNDPPILSAEPFSAFGFLDDDTPPAPISITGSQFKVEAGKTFALVGGEITINGANISGGQGIEIESRNVAPITVTNSTMKVEGEGRIFFRGGELVVMNSEIQVDSESAGSRIELDVTEMQLTDSSIRLNPIGGSDAGSIVIGMGHLNSLNLTNSKILGMTFGSRKGGTVQIKAANSITFSDNSQLNVSSFASGDAGSVEIETGSLSLTNLSFIGANTSGAGNAGDIQIQATNSITIEDNSFLTVSSSASGDAGSVDIDTGSLSLTNSSFIGAGTSGTGNAGEIQIQAANSLTLEDKSFLFVNTESSGDAGSVEIDTGSLSLTNSSFIGASTWGTGKGGDIQIQANDITLEDNSSLVVNSEGIGVESGDAGSLAIETGSLSLTNSSVIGAGTRGTGNAGDIQIKAANSITLEDKSLLGVTTIGKEIGSGDGGSLAIETGSLSLTNSSFIGATTEGTGNAGEIQIKAANSITLEEESGLVVGTSGSGDGGSLDIETGSLSLTNSIVGASTEDAGNAGEVQIKAANSITLVSDSGLSVDTSGSGDGGSLDIETGSLSLTNSIVGASTEGAGNAGEVQIKANNITLVSDSENSEKSGLIVDTDSSGDAGLLFIDTGSLSITNSVIQASTHGPGKGGNVQIKANSIAFSDGSELNVLAFSGSTGDAGSLAIDTGSLSLTNSSFISAGTEGSGEGGEIQIQANDITLSNESSLDVSTIGSGDAGSLFIETGSLSLTNNAFIASFTQGTGNAGDIQIKAANSITLGDESFLSVATLGEEIGSGDAGSLAIETGSLSLTNSSAIGAGTLGSGSAGKITITASEYIKIVGADSGIFSASGDENFPNATGNAGTITIGKDPSVPAPTLTLTEGGEISTASWGAGVSGEIDINVKNLEINQGGKINSSSQGSGSAGKITITASEYLKIFGANSGIFSTSRATGNAGTITIGGETMPVPTLTVTESGQISTSTFGAGEGGEIDININNLEITQGGKINSSSSGTGSAGKIAITASEYVQIFGNNSGIFSTASSSGNAGQINILAGGTPEDGVEIIPGSLFSASAELIPHERGGLVLENGGEISTSTTGQGDGGTITITSSKLRLNNASITADNEVADFNQAGNIIIGAHQLDMSDSRISTSSTNADGGNILIGVRELNNKRITDSEIAATAGETGIGGNLEISGPKYLILDSTNLKADADKGGNLTVDADVFIASSDSQVEASGVLQTPEHIDVGTISLLPNQGVDASKMIKDCLAYDSEEEWSLKQVGYGERKKGCIK